MEGYDAATYGDGFADVYDDWYGDGADVAAAVEALAGWALATGGPVLELGVGSGRLALPLAGRGVDVWGIDASPAMVGRLRAKPGGKHLPVAIGDMAELDLSGLPGGPDARFGLVFAAFNTLFNVADEPGQRRCLERVAAVLAPAGRFVIEAFVPGDGHHPSAVEAVRVDLASVVLSVSRRRRDSQVVDGQHVEITEQGVRLRPWSIRYATPAQLDGMAGAAGLRLHDRYGAWDRSPFGPDSPAHVSVYGRA
ncbi:MAG: class I SAM-dependent DNA methyltransferase [Acidimicrobiia bacterium]